MDGCGVAVTRADHPSRESSEIHTFVRHPFDKSQRDISPCCQIITPIVCLEMKLIALYCASLFLAATLVAAQDPIGPLTTNNAQSACVQYGDCESSRRRTR